MRWFKQPASNSDTPARAQRNLAAWTLLCGVLLLAAMCGPFFAGRVYTSDDLGAFHLPLRQFYAQCLERGDPFDWCPQLYSGFYLSGEGQVGMYHPLHWLLYRFLNLQTAFDLELLLSYPLLLAGCYLFFNRHVANRAAAMFGAVVFTFSGFNTLHFVHPHAVAITAHLPWLLWCWDIAWRRSEDWRGTCALAGIALLTASQVLLGYPQYVWLSLLAEAAYAGFLWRQARPTWRLIGRCASALALGALAGAVQWLPTWDLLAESQRQQVDSSFALTGALHPLNVVQLIAPYLFETRVAGGNTHELGLYIGMVPLLLIVWILSRRDTVPRSPFLNFALGLTVVAFVLALGANGGLYVLQTWLPVVGKFRLPARYLVLVHFGLAAVASVALARLLGADRNSTATGASARTLGKLVVASVVLALAAPWVWEDEFVATPLLMCAGPVLLALSAGTLLLCLRQTRGAVAAIVALTVLDLGAYGLSYAVYPNTVRLSDYLAAGAPPKLTTGYRIATEAPEATVRTGNHLIVRGCRQVDGYAGLEPSKQLDYRQTAALRVAGVQWVLDQHENRWVEVPDPLPRVRLVGKAVVSLSPREGLARIDVKTEALVGEPGFHHAERDDDVGGARLVDDRPGRLRVTVDAPDRRLLVVAESFHRGWRAEIDGRPHEVIRVNGDFMGCVVEPGRHEVRLSFQPASLIWGRRLSLAGIVGIGLTFVLWLRAGRKETERRRETTHSIETERELALVE